MVQATNEITEILTKIDPELERRRKGAWQAFNSNSIDLYSQSLSSMREVLNQLLDKLSPREEIMKAPWYKTTSKGEAKITRPMKVRYALSRNLEPSEKDVKLIETFADLIDILYSKLSAGVHQRGIGIELQIEAYLKLCEAAIINLWVHRKVINGWTIELRCNTVPFNDIRVRKAMQMAIDRKTMARVLDDDWKIGKPTGLISPKYVGFFTPFEKWPHDLQAEYSYNPVKAKKLLEEAGYPNGFVTYVTVPASDVDTVAVVAAYFKAIGLNTLIDVKELAVWTAMALKGKITQMVGLTKAMAIDAEPKIALTRRSKNTKNNFTMNNDEKYEELLNKIEKANTIEELKQSCIDADIYALRQHWAIQLYI